MSYKVVLSGVALPTEEGQCVESIEIVETKNPPAYADESGLDGLLKYRQPYKAGVLLETQPPSIGRNRHDGSGRCIVRSGAATTSKVNL